MFILRIIRFFIGYVKFSGMGVYPERFLNMCTKQNIEIWNVRHSGDCFFACVNARKYRELRRPARKSGIRLKVRKRVGFPFITYRYRNRWGTFIGIALFIGILIFLQSFIWTVQVTGNRDLNARVIQEVYAEVGLKPGTPVSELNLSELESNAMNMLPELAWTAINVTGSHALIEVREKKKAPEILDEKTPCNIKASWGGQIIDMEVYEGQPMVDIGDSVAAGDLIVSGAIQNKDMSTTFVPARGKITAKTKRTIRVDIPLNQEKISYTGKTLARDSIEFFGLTIPLYFGNQPGDGYELAEENDRAVINDVELPISIHKSLWKEFRIDVETVSREEAKILAESMVAEREVQEMKDKEVLYRVPKFEFPEGRCELTVYYDCEEDIAFLEEILLHHPEN